MCVFVGHTGAVLRRRRRRRSSSVLDAAGSCAAAETGLDWAGLGFGRLWSSSGRPGRRSCLRHAGASPGPSWWTYPEAAPTCVASGDVLYAGLCGSEQRDEIKQREMTFAQNIQLCLVYINLSEMELEKKECGNIFRDA